MGFNREPFWALSDSGLKQLNYLISLIFNKQHQCQIIQKN